VNLKVKRMKNKKYYIYCPKCGNIWIVDTSLELTKDEEKAILETYEKLKPLFIELGIHISKQECLRLARICKKVFGKDKFLESGLFVCPYCNTVIRVGKVIK